MSNIGSYMLRRVLLLVPMLLGLSLVMFALIHLAPGDPALAFISEQNSSAEYCRVAEMMPTGTAIRRARLSARAWRVMLAPSRSKINSVTGLRLKV